MTIRLAAAMTITGLLAGCAPATPPAPRVMGQEARIPFADQRGIRNFRANGNNGLWIQDLRRNWYYAELFGPCPGLNFAQRIGFNNRGTSSLDRFGQIIVEGRPCQIRSFVTSDPPPPRRRATTSSND